MEELLFVSGLGLAYRLLRLDVVPGVAQRVLNTAENRVIEHVSRALLAVIHWLNLPKSV